MANQSYSGHDTAKHSLGSSYNSWKVEDLHTVLSHYGVRYSRHAAKNQLMKRLNTLAAERNLTQVDRLAILNTHKRNQHLGDDDLITEEDIHQGGVAKEDDEFSIYAESDESYVDVGSSEDRRMGEDEEGCGKKDNGTSSTKATIRRSRKTRKSNLVYNEFVLTELYVIGFAFQESLDSEQSNLETAAESETSDAGKNQGKGAMCCQCLHSLASDRTPTLDCEHEMMFCEECLASYISKQMKPDSSNQILCPGCDQLLKHEDLQFFADAYTFQRYLI